MRKLRIAAILFLSMFLFACASKDDQLPEVTPEVPEVTAPEESTENTETLPETTEAETSAEETLTVEPVAEEPALEEIEEPEVQDLPLEEPEVVPEPEKETAVETVEEIPAEPVEEIEELPAIEEPDNTNFDDIPTEGTGEEGASVIVRWTEDTADEPEAETAEETTFEAETTTEPEESETAAEETQEAETENTPEEAQEEEVEQIEIIPSRSVTLNKGETLIVIYPGSGWIYMGSLSEYNNMASKGRKLGATDTKYTLLAKESGTQIHHFYKEDNLTGQYIDDYLEVTVTTKKSNSKVTVTAPAYSEIVPEKPAKSEAKKHYENLEAAESKPSKKEKAPSAKSESTEAKTEKQQETTSEKPAEKQAAATSESKTQKAEEPSTSFYIQQAESEDQVDEVIEVNNSNDDDILFIEEETDVDTDALLDEATAAYESKDYAKALDNLNQFFEHAEARRDEALFLKGQILEQDSYLKDIKGAVNSYQSLIDNYPASSYWNKANKRIIYLRRFYIEVR